MPTDNNGWVWGWVNVPGGKEWHTFYWQPTFQRRTFRLQVLPAVTLHASAMLMHAPCNLSPGDSDFAPSEEFWHGCWWWWWRRDVGCEGMERCVIKCNTYTLRLSYAILWPLVDFKASTPVIIHHWDTKTKFSYSRLSNNNEKGTTVKTKSIGADRDTLNWTRQWGLKGRTHHPTQDNPKRVVRQVGLGKKPRIE